MLSETREYPTRQAHRVRNFLLGILAIVIVLSFLWITGARGYIALPNWVLPVLRSRPYGPINPLYGGWVGVAALTAGACVLVPLAVYVIYRIARATSSDKAQ